MARILPLQPRQQDSQWSVLSIESALSPNSALSPSQKKIRPLPPIPKSATLSPAASPVPCSARPLPSPPALSAAQRPLFFSTRPSTPESIKEESSSDKPDILPQQPMIPLSVQTLSKEPSVLLKPITPPRARPAIALSVQTSSAALKPRSYRRSFHQPSPSSSIPQILTPTSRKRMSNGRVSLRRHEVVRPKLLTKGKKGLAKEHRKENRGQLLYSRAAALLAKKVVLEVESENESEDWEDEDDLIVAGKGISRRLGERQSKQLVVRNHAAEVQTRWSKILGVSENYKVLTPPSNFQ
ncbi:hypothetical protein C8J56DRAFT_429709 [Mycena floridula]|nr:hypothetical protein C8J56DRAFT_429709 [Mycena floridula]